jgi:hypothetical protein
VQGSAPALRLLPPPQQEPLAEWQRMHQFDPSSYIHSAIYCQLELVNFSDPLKIAENVGHRTLNIDKTL